MYQQGTPRGALLCRAVEVLLWESKEGVPDCCGLCPLPEAAM